jgi:hypothetical protein
VDEGERRRQKEELRPHSRGKAGLPGKQREPTGRSKKNAHILLLLPKRSRWWKRQGGRNDSIHGENEEIEAEDNAGGDDIDDNRHQGAAVAEGRAPKRAGKHKQELKLIICIEKNHIPLATGETTGGGEEGVGSDAPEEVKG